ncbi:MAG: site-2 protease family protein [Pseudonocardiaceae bacterium]
MLSPGGLVLGRVGGIPVLLTPSWWLGAVIITTLYAPLVHELLPQAGLTRTVVLAATVTVLLAMSVLAHELGHCAVARHLGIPVRRVRLFLLGGVSELGRRPAGPREEGLVALAGPAVSVVLALIAGVGWWVVDPGSSIWLLVAELAVANTAVALFNLLPGLPLDGGRALRAAVWAVTGRRGAGTAAAVVGAGFVTAALLSWAGFGLLSGADGAWLRLAVCLLMAWFVVTGASAEVDAEHTSWPEGLDPATLVRPVLQLPAESPVADTLAAAAGRGIILVRADGIAAGLLNMPMAEQLALASPRSPAEHATEPIRPESVVLDGESGHEVLDRLRGTTYQQLLVVDADGRPIGVLHRDDVLRALGSQR